jgi:hypothetical protein
MTTLTRTITVAGGVFASGLGELTQCLPFELVDAVLEETGVVQRRLRDLPSRVGMYRCGTLDRPRPRPDRCRRAGPATPGGSMTPERRVQALRVLAALWRGHAAQLDMAAAAVTTAAALRNLAAAVGQADAADIAAHPDLAYLDLQINGYYDNPPPPRNNP